MASPQARPGSPAPAAEPGPAGDGDDLPTVAAAAVLAFASADVAHEVVGHGAGYLAAGGGPCVLTTTRLIEHRLLGEAGGRIFSIGGPAGNLALAALALWLLGRRRPASATGRWFLWTCAAFNLMWALGYLIYSGVTARGDWAELVRGLAPPWLWRPALVVLGLALIRSALGVLARRLDSPGGESGAETSPRAWRLVTTAYLAAGIIACLAAWPDPRGPFQIVESAVPETFLGNLPLLLIPLLAGRSTGRKQPAAAPDAVIARSAGWIVAAVSAGLILAGILGPGVEIG